MKDKDTNVPEIRELKITRQPSGKSYIPGFRIQGKWLVNLGYNYNDIVRIFPLPDGSINISKLQEGRI